MTPIKVFQEAVERGLNLCVESRDRLTVQPAERCLPEFADKLRAQMPFAGVAPTPFRHGVFSATA